MNRSRCICGSLPNPDCTADHVADDERDESLRERAIDNLLTDPDLIMDFANGDPFAPEVIANAMLCTNAGRSRADLRNQFAIWHGTRVEKELRRLRDDRVAA